jgi:hypothetical protein
MDAGGGANTQILTASRKQERYHDRDENFFDKHARTSIFK